MTDEAKALLERLPELLRKTPQLRYQIYDLLAERFVEKAEFNRLLAEMQASRETAERRFQAIEAELKAGREASDRRFEAVQKQMDHRFDEAREASNRRFDDIVQRYQDLKDWVGLNVGGLQNRAGRKLEDVVAGTLRVALNLKDLDPETIKLRQRLRDAEGLIGKPGKTYEYDIFVSNGRTRIFEVKSVPEEEDVERFADKCELAAHVLKLEQPRKVLITLAKTPELAQCCRELGVELV